MKTTIAKVSIAALLALSLFLSFGSAFAAPPSPKVYPDIDWKRAELNYVAGLGSDNVGVRRSCAGFLGEYRLKNAVEPLINMLRCDKVESVRMASALALILIDTPESRAAVEEASVYDGSDKVAKFCQSLLTTEHGSISAALESVNFFETLLR
ncbi:MAG: HEAT repeat domain-containing protein [Bacteroidota bacterium]|nr:HEAT repeat domain-containing protein [Bacteroidota bacterium]